jgi:hypothetical protein
MKGHYLLVILFSLFLFSCKETNPVLEDVKTHLVIDNRIDENMGTWFSVFVQIDSDVFRSESITISIPTVKLKWLASPEIYVSKDKTYVGVSCLRYPDETFSLFDYQAEFVFTDIAGKQEKLFFTIPNEKITYDEKKYIHKKIALFDMNERLLYYGVDKKLNSTREILAKYGTAKTIYSCMTNNTDTVIFITDKKDLTQN